MRASKPPAHFRVDLHTYRNTDAWAHIQAVRTRFRIDSTYKERPVGYGVVILGAVNSKIYSNISRGKLNRLIAIGGGVYV